MRKHAPILAIATLLLAGCGEEQTAQAPDETTTASPTETVQTTPATPAEEPADSTPTAVGAAPTTPGAAPSAPGTAGPAPQAASADLLGPYQGRRYLAGPVSLQLNPDNTFVLNEVEGDRRVEGGYSHESGVITFANPKGDVGPAKFPMRCRFEAAGDQFRLADSGGSCERFEGLTFAPAAG